MSRPIDQDSIILTLADANQKLDSDNYWLKRDVSKLKDMLQKCKTALNDTKEENSALKEDIKTLEQENTRLGRIVREQEAHLWLLLMRNSHL